MDIARAPNLGDQVYEIIKERIVQGQYKPGEIIVESEVATDLNVSRTPVSIAFVMLKERGLVEYDGSRYSVKTLSMKNIIDLYKCRLALDALATASAASNITDDDLTELKGYLKQWDESSASTDIWVADLRFHEKIYNLSRNQHLIRFSVIATELLSTYRHINISRLPKQRQGRHRSLQNVVEEHEDIFRALYERDPVLAEQAARTHIANVINNLETLNITDPDLATDSPNILEDLEAPL